jgi:hypothetical protein
MSTTTMATTTNNITLDFPTTTITPITDSQSHPLYASLRVTQTELNGSAASVHSNLGNGLHGHLALTILTTKYLVLTNNVQFVAPINPLAQPIHPAGATDNQITKIKCQHLKQKQAFKTYHKVNQELCNQIIVAVPNVYIWTLKHPTTGFGNVTSLQLLTCLWSNYITIPQKELDDNQAQM